jgi:uncharacterized membrane protein YidH (DUF202 family)
MTGPDADLDPDPEEADPGLARERTHMAWTRTAISFAAAGAAILKDRPVAGIIVLALGLVTWVLPRAFPQLGTGYAARRRRLLLITIAVTAVAIVALGVAFTGRLAGR